MGRFSLLFSAACAATALAFLPAESAVADPAFVDLVLVDKSDRTMTLLAGGEVVREYSIALGRNPLGDKVVRGDKRTPEGSYTLDYKNPASRFYKSIHVSYPDDADVRAAIEAGVDPGGDIMIHGQKNGYGQFAPVTQQVDWTDGCIAVADHEMDEIWNLVSVGTRIEIRP